MESPRTSCATTAPASIRRAPGGSFARSSGSTPSGSSRGPASGCRSSSASFTGTGGGSGQLVLRSRARRSGSPWGELAIVRARKGNAVHSRMLLLVEDNPDDEALTLRALCKHGLVRNVIVAHDGVEALELL